MFTINEIPGLRTESAVIPGEDQSKFDRHLERQIDFWQPRDVYERDLVEQIAINRWRLARFERYEATAFLANMPEDKRALTLQRIGMIIGRIERSAAFTVSQLHKYRDRLKELEEAEAGKEGAGIRFIPGLLWEIGGEKTYMVLPQVRGLDGKLHDIPREVLADRFHPPDPAFKPTIVGRGGRTTGSET